ncbi:MAG: OprO/OprP family phosphate-selective porin [Paramuribaculum sp.]|nr:OprO/OprP family phosphate-selective porin [Paramuribaculum sp.]
MRKVITFVWAALIAAAAAGAEPKDSAAVSYMPQFHGTVRARFEYATAGGEYRFQVRNARFAINGNISREISYFVNTDLCDRGKMKILDAWAKAEFVPHLSLQAGQFRMPFGVDPFRAPHQYYFANRSFIGKQMCNYRAVGAMLIYDFACAPLKLEAGAFNPYSIGDHTGWGKKLAAAGKATLGLGDFKVSAGGASIYPSGIRANMTGACLSWSRGRWIAEGEYMYKHYLHGASRNAHAYSVFTSYYMPVKAGIFNRLSVQGRFDGITDHSDCAKDENGLLHITDAARNRITAGATLTTMKAKNMFFDFRVDYEKNFYRHGFKPAPEYGDKLVAEIVLRF